MKKTCTFLIMILSVILASCTSYAPPQNYTFEKVKTIDKSYNEVWGKLIEYLGEHYSLNDLYISKRDGYITCKQTLLLPSSNSLECIDCGTDRDNNIFKDKYLDGIYTTYNITVQRAGKKQTIVKINVLAYFTGKTQTYDRQGIVTYMYCTSTGKFETELLDFISK